MEATARPAAPKDSRERFLRSDTELDGSSAHKRIFKAYDTEEGLEVAMHVVTVGANTLPSTHSALSLENDNLIKIVDSWREGNEVVYVTPIVTAGTLAGYCARIDDVRSRVVRKWCRHILGGLEYMHNAGRAHGDLRLSNVFINGESGNVLLGSFGVGEVSDDGEQLRRTLRYAAPELLQGGGSRGGPPTPEQDVYAFGMCVLEMVTRRVPYSAFDDDNLASVQAKKLAGQPPRELETLVVRPPPTDGDDSAGGVDGWSAEELAAVRAMISQCLSLVPGNRPTVRQLLESEFIVESDRERETRRAKERDDLEKEEREKEAREARESAAREKRELREREAAAVVVVEPTLSPSPEPAAPTLPVPKPMAVEKPAPAPSVPLLPVPAPAPQKPPAPNGNLGPASAAASRPSTGRRAKRPPTRPRIDAIRLTDIHLSAQPRVDVSLMLYYASGDGKEGKERGWAYRQVRLSLDPRTPLDPGRIAAEMVVADLVSSDDVPALCAWFVTSLGPLLTLCGAGAAGEGPHLLEAALLGSYSAPSEKASPRGRERGRSRGTAVSLGVSGGVLEEEEEGVEEWDGEEEGEPTPEATRRSRAASTSSRNAVTTAADSGRVVEEE